MYKIAGFPENTTAHGCLIGKTMVLWGPTAGARNGADVKELTEEEIDVRTAVYDDLEEKKKKADGQLDGAVVIDTGTHIGVRQTRFIEGEYKITGEDVLEGREFNDSVAMAANPIIHYYGYRRFLPHEGYQIPYRCLVPKKIDNFYVAGRCMSSDQRAFESWRAMAHVFAIGEAAGVAAAQCQATGKTPRQLDVERLQASLIKQGCEIGQGKRRYSYVGGNAEKDKT